MVVAEGEGDDTRDLKGGEEVGYGQVRLGA